MKHTFIFPSNDKKQDLSLYVWTAKKPIAVLQLIHGMAEYAERYEPFIRFLNQHQITVIAHDHLGHGNSIHATQPEYGFFSEKNAKHHLLEDIHHVAQLAKKAYPDLPLIALGHSMGSFALRCTTVHYPKLYDGVIFMGTGEAPKQLMIGLPLTSFLQYIAPHQQNHVLDALTFGFYGFHYKEPYDRISWLSCNKVNREQFKADPKLGFTFTNNGFYTLFRLVRDANTSSFYKLYSKTLPTLLVSGIDDPIGQYGQGVTNIYKKLIQENVQYVDIHLYPQARHELLNEPHTFQQACHDIYQWISNVINKKSRSK